MIAECAVDLLAKLRALPEFGTPSRVGITSGGKGLDPAMTKVSALPACWVVYTGSESLETEPTEGCPPRVRLSFVVKTILEYGNESEMLSNSYPVLEKVIRAINGTPGPSTSKKWRFTGESMDEMTGNRIVFDQTFTVESFLL